MLIHQQRERNARTRFAACERGCGARAHHRGPNHFNSDVQFNAEARTAGAADALAGQISAARHCGHPKGIRTWSQGADGRGEARSQGGKACTRCPAIGLGEVQAALDKHVPGWREQLSRGESVVITVAAAAS